jgi:hypothetical protein
MRPLWPADLGAPAAAVWEGVASIYPVSALAVPRAGANLRSIAAPVLREPKLAARMPAQVPGERVEGGFFQFSVLREPKHDGSAPIPVLQEL